MKFSKPVDLMSYDEAFVETISFFKDPKSHVYGTFDPIRIGGLLGLIALENPSMFIEMEGDVLIQRINCLKQGIVELESVATAQKIIYHIVNVGNAISKPSKEAFDLCYISHNANITLFQFLLNPTAKKLPDAQLQTCIMYLLKYDVDEYNKEYIKNSIGSLDNLWKDSDKYGWTVLTDGTDFTHDDTIDYDVDYTYQRYDDYRFDDYRFDLR